MREIQKGFTLIELMIV
ncbi:MAG TPA: hypothetical protein DES72_07480, partial [Gammaproteobacteria bacterium]|nr:hypothetical protein [Gammaproteobacteria bacterium]